MGEQPTKKPGRRALVIATALGGCALSAMAGAPTIRVLIAPLGDSDSGGRWVRTTLRLSDLVEGEPRRVAVVSDRTDAWTRERDVELGSVWLVRRGETALAFSAVCPHLGCSVNVAAEKGAGFACPCHTSSFDGEGKRKSGPSPRDLDRLATRVEDGFVAVDFRRFKIGVAEKVEA